MITERPAVSTAAPSAPAPVARAGVRGVVRAYVALTKPRIIELLLVTTVPAMMLAADGIPSWWLMAVVLVGGSLAAGAANVLNCYLDRDIDERMGRTRRRPLPAHKVSPRNALIFGLLLAVASTAVMAVFTNWLATALTVAAIVYYDLVYTFWLKRSTWLNTFWGGVCGAAPVLIGWAAVTGSLAPPAWALFGAVFFWQLPHFYALALKFKDDYARAGVPMLSVVASQKRVTAEIVMYAWLTVVCSLLLWPLGSSPVYGFTAAAAGALFLAEAHRLHNASRKGGGLKPMRLFHSSNTYLTILSIGIVVDVLL